MPIRLCQREKSAENGLRFFNLYLKQQDRSYVDELQAVGINFKKFEHHCEKNDIVQLWRLWGVAFAGVVT